jgi:carbon monoxide dehydrogenase subunit G
MKLEQSFTVLAPLETVWDALTNVDRVAPCLPGATLGPGSEDGVYEGTFAVKLGPAAAAYQGTLEMAALDEANHTTTMRASGRDKRGQGAASATIVSRLVAEGDGTRVDVDTDFTITGRLARFGRGGMIQDISNNLLREFASCLQERLAGEQRPPASAEASPPSAEAPGTAEPPATPSAPPGREAPAQPGPRQINGLALLFSVLRERLRRLFRGRRG